MEKLVLCDRCQVSMKRFGVKFDEGRVMIAYGCPICLVKKFVEEEDEEGQCKQTKALQKR